MRTIDFSYRVLRNGAFFGYLQAHTGSAPMIRMNETAEIKTSLSGDFSTFVTDADGNLLEPNWLSDEIQPVMIVDGVEHSLGIFAMASVTPVEANGIQSMRVEAFDRCWRVRDTNAETRPYFASGTPYITAIEILLTGAGISTVLATPSGAVLAEDREDWEIGTSYLSIINQLLGEINYNPLFFTSEGYAILEPASVPAPSAIDHRISDAQDEIAEGAARIDQMLPQISRETDVYNTPNVFVCCCANPDKSENMVASAVNENPQSPLSVLRRGRRVVRVTQLDNIATLEELQAYADRQRNESLIGGETINIITALQPDYGVDDVVALRYKDLAAICILRAYTMELRVGGTMQMALEKVVYNFG